MIYIGEDQRSHDVMNTSPSNDVASISPRDHTVTSPSADVIPSPVRFSSSDDTYVHNKVEPKLTDSEYGSVSSSANILRAPFAFER